MNLVTDSGSMKLNTPCILSATVVLVLVSILTACSTQPMQFSGSEASELTTRAVNVLPVEINQTLTANSQDFSVLISSGLNKNRNLTASATYFAASGRFCRKLAISDDVTDEQYIACSAKAAEWEIVRINI